MIKKQWKIILSVFLITLIIGIFIIMMLIPRYKKMGMDAYHNGNYELAVKYLERVYPFLNVKKTDDSSKISLLGSLYLDINKPKRAKVILERKLKMLPGAIQTQYNFGRAYYMLGDLDKAEEEFKKILTLERWKDGMKVPLSHEGLAAIYQKRGDLEKALEYIKISLETIRKTEEKFSMDISPYLLAITLFRQASIYIDLKDFDSATKALDRFSERLEKEDNYLFSEKPLRYFYRAKIHDSQGDKDKAMSYYGKFLQEYKIKDENKEFAKKRIQKLKQ
jgi:tetratricopeptide (TPR) repeat protein